MHSWRGRAKKGRGRGRKGPTQQPARPALSYCGAPAPTAGTYQRRQLRASLEQSLQQVDARWEPDPTSGCRDWDGFAGSCPADCSRAGEHVPGKASYWHRARRGLLTQLESLMEERDEWGEVRPCAPLAPPQSAAAPAAGGRADVSGGSTSEDTSSSSGSGSSRSSGSSSDSDSSGSSSSAASGGGRGAVGGAVVAASRTPGPAPHAQPPAPAVKLRGVALTTSGKWRAQVGQGGVKYNLGSFESRGAAVREYDLSVLALAGPSTKRCNQPLDTYAVGDIKAQADKAGLPLHAAWHAAPRNRKATAGSSSRAKAKAGRAPQQQGALPGAVRARAAGAKRSAPDAPRAPPPSAKKRRPSQQQQPQEPQQQQQQKESKQRQQQPQQQRSNTEQAGAAQPAASAPAPASRGSKQGAGSAGGGQRSAQQGRGGGDGVLAQPQACGVAGLSDAWRSVAIPDAKGGVRRQAEAGSRLVSTLSPMLAPGVVLEVERVLDAVVLSTASRDVREAVGAMLGRLRAYQQQGALQVVLERLQALATLAARVHH